MENSVDQWINRFYFETTVTSTIILYINISQLNSLFQKKEYSD